MSIDIFVTSLPIIGLVHLPPLPGSPGHCLDQMALEAWVLRDVQALVDGGVDGLIVENFGDAPYYPARVPPETVAAMTLLAARVRSTTDLPLGINVLRNDGYSALAIATAVGAAFVRVNVYTGARLTDQGIVEGEAHQLQRYRRALGSTVRIFADVAVKHSSALSDRSLPDEVEDTVSRGRADAIIVSGAGTGKPTAVSTLREVKQAAGPAPVFVGSGVSLESISDLAPLADGLIVGTAFKENGVVTNPVSVSRVRDLTRAAEGLRKVP